MLADIEPEFLALFEVPQANYANPLQSRDQHYPGRDRSFPRPARKMAVVCSN
jgi:hypothetical protein